MKRFLVAIDGSNRALQVVATAADMARQFGAKLLLFRAVGLPPELPSEFYSQSTESLEVILLRRATQELALIGRDVDPALLEGSYSHIGTPWDAICRAAIEHDVDLIIVGSHGYGGLDRLLGTTAAKVVNHADCAVFVVRPKSKRAGKPA